MILKITDRLWEKVVKNMKESEAKNEKEEEDGYEFFYGIENEWSEDMKKRIWEMWSRKGRGILISLNEYNEKIRIEKLVRAMKFGLKVALVSDAGTPTVSDPGYGFIRAAVKDGISIEALPGPSAVLVAVAACGLCPNGFTFHGYLNKTESMRIDQLKFLKAQLNPFVLFENPKWVAWTLYEIE